MSGKTNNIGFKIYRKNQKSFMSKVIKLHLENESTHMDSKITYFLRGNENINPHIEGEEPKLDPHDIVHYGLFFDKELSIEYINHCIKLLVDDVLEFEREY